MIEFHYEINFSLKNKISISKWIDQTIRSENKITGDINYIFCTDDLEYQNFKEEVRNDMWQQEFLAKDLKDRQEIAKNLRKVQLKIQIKRII